MDVNVHGETSSLLWVGTKLESQGIQLTVIQAAADGETSSVTSFDSLQKQGKKYKSLCRRTIYSFVKFNLPGVALFYTFSKYYMEGRKGINVF